MRLIKTFILHLYTDTERREQFCGDLQALAGRKAFTFKKNSELLALLQRLANEEIEDLPMIISQDETDPDLNQNA